MAIKSKRIYEIAKEFGVSSQAMVKILRDLNFNPKSHMSVSTAEMVYAVNKKFADERQSAKREMDQKREARNRRRAQAIVAQKPRTTGPAAPPTAPPRESPVRETTEGKTPLARRMDRKKKKKDRRQRKEKRQVDQQEVTRSYRATMATLTSTKPKKRYRHTSGTGESTTVDDRNILSVNEYMSVAELGKLMDHKPVEVIAKLFEMGMMATINQRLDLDTIEMIAAEFGFDIRVMSEIGEASKEEEQEETLEARAPVVTIMGHVDHGKTSLLDYIRRSDVVAGEAGAITQHIGAYEVTHKGNRIVFLDTPGHEAFTAMRARGTQITDIVVIVVAADEGIKPQTIEAIDHSRAANVPMIVAISKIDKPAARLDEVRTQLANQNLLAEDWGGKTITVEISSKTGQGIEKLLDMIVLQAEMLDLKADPTIRAQGVIVDARLERGRGPVATVLVKKGSCRISVPIVAGVHYGRVRTITNDRDHKLEIIGPSTPAQITGLSGVPQAGDSFLVVRSDQEAKEITLKRSQVKREHEFHRSHVPVSLAGIFDQIQEGQIKEVRLIIKGDVDGSVEVLSDTLGKIATQEVKTNIIRQGVGAITESDVLLAAASDAIIIGFQVSPDARARTVAQRESVDIRLYDVVYEAEDDIRKALEGLLSPDISEKFVGLAEVRDTFKIPRAGTIAGSYVKEGRIGRNTKIRLIRDGKRIYTGSIASLKRFKEDAKEVKEGFECGIGIENFNDIKVGDIIEAFETVEVARTLN